ncbi:MAG: amidohydrolase/deacetylase family metallohydrolase [Acidobacteria bacterium]|nr:amidohydrolase/deacetylase family metallohydrolase [Acidobacteriota bacterium]
MALIMRSVSLGLISLAGALSCAAQPYDLVIQNGHVIDPALGVNGVRDVAIRGDRIARVAERIGAAGARRVIDARGRYVVAGLVDLHAHVFGYSGSLNPDESALPACTTTVVDAGGAGWRTFETFKNSVINKSRTRVLSLLNIVGKGMVGEAAESDTEDMDSEATAKKILQYPGVIVGIKTAHFGKPGWTAIDRAVGAGKLANVPVMVDDKILTGSGRTSREKLLDRMRPGDMHTHMFNDRQVEVIDRFTGRVQPWMIAARQRGVLFDLGHGAGSFLWPVASKAMQQGFAPDTISTDLHSSSILLPSSDMPNCMSKMMSLGMTLEDTIAKSTAAPARAIRQQDTIGSLAEGRIADVAILDLREGVFAYVDAWHHKSTGTRKLECAATVRAGQVAYERPSGGDRLVSAVYDLILKGGRVNGQRQDVAVAAGKVARIAPELPGRAGRKVVLADGYDVVVGEADLPGVTEHIAMARCYQAAGKAPAAPREGMVANLGLVDRGRCGLTMRAGKVQWDPDGISLTEWTTVGPYSNYK